MDIKRIVNSKPFISAFLVGAWIGGIIYTLAFIL